jgi:Ca2+-binding EF-hand superfamily protein
MIRSIGVFIGLLAFTSLVYAADDDGLAKKIDPEKVFKRLDSNDDGKLSKDEFLKLAELRRGKEGKGKGDSKAFLEKLFDKLDADSDGYLSLDEFKKLSQLREQFMKKKKKDE